MVHPLLCTSARNNVNQRERNLFMSVERLNSPWWIVCLTTIVLLSGCQSPWTADMNGESTPEPKYSLLDNYTSRDALRRVSTLPVIDSSGTLNVCIRFTDPSWDTSSLRSRIEDETVRAVNDWNDFLNTSPPGDGFPAWVRSSVPVNFGCSSSPLYHIVADPSEDRAYAEVMERRMVLDNDALTTSRLYYVIAHEYGHLMGLGDTYYEPGYGYDIEDHPDSMMRTASGFTEDDRAGIWNLWRFLVNGGDPCGPGYTTQGEIWSGTFCVLPEDAESGGSSESGCRYSCDLLYLSSGECRVDDGGNSWYCDTSHCLQHVETCRSAPDDGGSDDGGASCDYACSDYGYSEGQCNTDVSTGASWECFSDGCLYSVGGCGGEADSGSDGGGSSCELACADYDMTVGQCGHDESGGSWECFSDGCLHSVAACSGDDSGDDGGSTCDFACSDYGYSMGMCQTDRAGNTWECRSDGCLYSVSSCGDDGSDGGSTCELACADYDMSVGQCGHDTSGGSWECQSDGCLHEVASCGGDDSGSSCDFACSDYGYHEGMCHTDSRGNTWECRSDGCLYNVSSC